MTKIYSALALLLATTSPSFADEPVTKWQWGCEWQQADNGNYWFKTDGGCPFHVALGYASANEMRGKDMKPETEDDDDDEGDDEEGPGEGPGDDEGPSDGGDNGGEGPGDNGGGNEGPCDEGPSEPGKDRPGKGKGKGRA